MKQDRQPRTPDEMVAGQARITPALQYLAGFRPARRLIVVEDVPPISGADVAAWVDQHPFVRSTLAPHVARSLAYLDRFKRRDALTEALDLKGVRA